MEPVVDGGLFELLIVMGMGFLINYIFLRKYLLIIFSVIALSSPVLLIINKGELAYVLCGISFFNSLLLIILLWRERERNPNSPLFDLKKFRADMEQKFYKLKKGS